MVRPYLLSVLKICRENSRRESSCSRISRISSMLKERKNGAIMMMKMAKSSSNRKMKVMIRIEQAK